jgi:hypothetical protein
MRGHAVERAESGPSAARGSASRSAPAISADSAGRLASSDACMASRFDGDSSLSMHAHGHAPTRALALKRRRELSEEDSRATDGGQAPVRAPPAYACASPPRARRRARDAPRRPPASSSARRAMPPRPRTPRMAAAPLTRLSPRARRSRAQATSMNCPPPPQPIVHSRVRAQRPPLRARVGRTRGACHARAHPHPRARTRPRARTARWAWGGAVANVRDGSDVPLARPRARRGSAPAEPSRAALEARARARDGRRVRARVRAGVGGT